MGGQHPGNRRHCIRKKQDRQGQRAGRKNSLRSGTRKVFRLEPVLFMSLFSVLLLALLLQIRGTRQSVGTVRQNHWNLVRNVRVRVGTGKNASWKRVTLPETIGDLPGGTTVTVSFRLQSDGSSMLFLNPVYSPVDIYADDKLIYSYGTQGTWPSYMPDPPTGAFSVKLPAHRDEHLLHVELVYTSPKSRSSLVLHSMVTGLGDAVLRYLFERYGYSWVSSLLFIIAGIIMCGLSLFYITFERHGLRLALPGLLIVLAGMWEFSENTMSVYLTHRPALLYILGFTGMYAMLLPLIVFVQKFTKMEGSLFLVALRWILEAAVLGSLFLQLAGVVPFTRSLYLFHVLLPAVLIFIAVYMLYLGIRKKNKPAVAMFLAILVLAVAAVLELLNYYFVFTERNSVLFQNGLQLFCLIILVFGCVEVRQNMELRYRNLELAHDIEMLEQSVEIQKERGRVLTAYESEIRRQRHDLRHHLRYLRQLLQDGKDREAAAYIESLDQAIPVGTITRYCENSMVNAVISYYAALAHSDQIRMEVSVRIPAANPHISDSHLCVILGNLLENAGEACRRMTEGERWIRLRTKVHGELLFISMDNSCEGTVQPQDGRYLSSKRNEEGIGLRSVRSLAKVHGGTAEFTSGDNWFRSEICVRL
jgi:signal transduction histidine kinase